MSLDDYFDGCNVKTKDELLNVLTKYHIAESVYIFNTYDFFDYVVHLIEADNNLKIIKVFDNINKYTKTFDEVVRKISDSTYFEINLELLNRLIVEYMHQKHGKYKP